MMRLFLWSLMAVILIGVKCGTLNHDTLKKNFQQDAINQETDYTEGEAQRFFAVYDVQKGIIEQKYTNAIWNYRSNITEFNHEQMLAVKADTAKFTKETWANLTKFPWKGFKDPDLRRKFQLLSCYSSSFLGAEALSEEDFKRYKFIESELETINANLYLCSVQNWHEECNFLLEPHLVEFLNDPEKKRQLLIEWHRNSTELLKELYTEFVELSNKVAKLNNLRDMAAVLFESYEAADFRGQIAALWDQVKPLYEQLHAFIRRNFRLKYGEKVVKPQGPIPSHLLSLLADIGNIKDFMLPYPNRQLRNVTPNMIEKNYTSIKLYQLAEQFFTSMNLSAMPETLWQDSIFEKPSDDRYVKCQPSAWDFHNAKDFRIMHCAGINQKDLYIAHHEIGHIQYFLEYKHHPDIYRSGANKAFHQAVADVATLSARTPKHLRAIGLLEEPKSPADEEAEREATVNDLFILAIEYITYLPFAYQNDLWIWDVFEGKISPQNYSCHQLKLTVQIQGVQPRIDLDYFSFKAASKSKIEKFVTIVILFQFHKALCKVAGQLENNAPLHSCDIYQSIEAGNLLRSMLQLGASKPWPEAMEIMTGQRNMDATALLEYFAPLEEWLRAENQRNNEFIGWEPTSTFCEGPST